MVALRRELPCESPHTTSPASPRARTRRRPAAAPALRAGFVAVTLSALSVLTALVLSWALWVTAARTSPPGSAPRQAVRTP